MSMLRRCWPQIIIVLAALLPIAAAFGGVIGAFDSIRQMHPWNASAASRPWDILQADSTLQFYGWRDMVFDSWSRHQLPLWNPYELAGTPLLANSQSAGFYPPHILVGLLHIPTNLAMTLLAWFHLAWAGLGAYFLARRLGGSRVGAATAGVAFTMSPFMLAWTSLSSVITTVAWIPWVLGLSVSIFQLSPDRGRPFFYRLATLAVCFAMMLLGGHLQFAAYGAISCALVLSGLAIGGPDSQVGLRNSGKNKDDEFDAHEVSKEPQRKSRVFPLACCVAALAVGGCLAAPQILPVLDYGKHSHRSNMPSELGYQAYAQNGGIGLMGLQGLVFPTALGNPAKTSPLASDTKANYWRIVKDSNGYWPQFAKVGANFAETAAGFGPLVFALLFFIRRPTRGQLVLGCVGAVFLLLALGTPLNRLLYFYVPGWSATGSPGRAEVIFLLVACVLAGTALDEVEKAWFRKRFKLLLAAGSICSLLLTAAPLVFKLDYPSLISGLNVPALIRETLVGEFPIILLTLAAAYASVFLFVEDKKWQWTVPTAAALCAYIAYGYDIVPVSSAPLAPVRGPTYDRIAIVNMPWSLFGPTNALMPPNTASVNRIHELGGYDSLIDRDTVVALKDADGQDPSPAANGNMMFVKPNADPAKLAALGVSEVWSLRPLAGFGDPADTASGFFKYRVNGPGRVSVDGRPARITSEDYSSVTVEAEGPGKLTVMDRQMAGWSAEENGASLPLGEGIWRQVQLGPGAHTVKFAYKPPGLAKGLVLFAIGFAALLVTLLVAFLRKTSSEPAP